MMKKRWILLIVAAVLVIAAVVVAIILGTRNRYFETLSYDFVDDSVYQNTMIVGEDGKFFLVRDGEQVSRGFTWLVSVNDYYDGLTDSMAKQCSDLLLFEYYLAREDNHSNYVLLNAAGDEFTVMGDTLTLDRVALPYLIFRDRVTSQYAVITLHALDSALSTQSAGELVPTETFLSVSPQRNRPDGALYTHLTTERTAAERPKSIYDDHGALILSANDLSPVLLENKRGRITCYWIDNEEFLLYAEDGSVLADGILAPEINHAQGWGFIRSETLTTATDGEDEEFLLVFSTEKTFVLSASDYDLDTVVPTDTGLFLSDKDHTATYVFDALSGDSAAYQTITVADGVLRATKNDTTQTFYLNQSGKLLMESPYSDMLPLPISTEACTVFHSAAFDEANGARAHYHFTAPEQAVKTRAIAANQTVTSLDLAQDSALAGSFVITETDELGDITKTLYTPFSTQQEGHTYDALDTYSAGGVYWCLGADYTELTYEIVDPVNNRVAASFNVEAEDFARLTFEHVTADQLITDRYNAESGVPVVILSMKRYEEKIDAVSRTRYIALYRQTTVEDEQFHNRTLVAKEIGQDLIPYYHDLPVKFDAQRNYLILHTTQGSKTMRMDETLDLIDTTALPYPIDSVLVDSTDPDKTYLILASGAPDSMGHRRYGLADADGTVLLAPYYDSIKSIADNRIVVGLKGAFGLLEYRKDKIKTLIEPIYQGIAPLGDGTYYAYDAYEHFYLYHGGKLLTDDPLPMLERLSVINTDNDGKPVYGQALLINHDGKLKLHMPEMLAPVACNSFESMPSYLDSEITHEHAQLVCYYDAGGTLLKTDLILPTAESLASFAESFVADEAVWYLSPVASKQTVPVIFEAITQARDNHVVKLYAGVTEKSAE